MRLSQRVRGQFQPFQRQFPAGQVELLARQRQRLHMPRARAERARAQVPYAPLTAEEAVKLKRMLFLVANAGVDKDYDWTQKVAGPGGVNLAMSIATSAMSAASRSARLRSVTSRKLHTLPTTSLPMRWGWE